MYIFRILGGQSGCRASADTVSRLEALPSCFLHEIWIILRQYANHLPLPTRLREQGNSEKGNPNESR